MKFALAIIALTTVEALKMKLRDATTVAATDATATDASYEDNAAYNQEWSYEGSYGDWTYMTYVNGDYSKSVSNNTVDKSWNVYEGTSEVDSTNGYHWDSKT